VPSSISGLRERITSPEGKKAIKYTAVSVISVAVSQVALLIFFGFLKWTARSSNVAATSIGAVPSYYLNRTWAWGKRGRSHLWKEIVPFWVLAFIGLALSTWAVDFAESWALTHHLHHLAKLAVVMGSALAAFGVLWIVKFVLFNKVIFVQDEDLQAALADEVVA
jgi:putative flippase GtrA